MIYLGKDPVSVSGYVDNTENSLELIAELTLEEDVHIAVINIDEKYKDYKFVIAKLENVNLTTADWIYPKINTKLLSGTSTSYYPKESVLSNRLNGWYKIPNGNWNTLAMHDAGLAGDLEFISFICYTSNVNMLAGSTFKIYGKKEV